MKTPPCTYSPEPHSISSAQTAWIAIAFALSLSSCAVRPGLETPPADERPCLLLPASSEIADTLRLVVDPEPLAREMSTMGADRDRLLYRQISENLFSVDCMGRLRPAIARDWESPDSGRSWRFTLDPRKRFNDMSPLSPAIVERILSQYVTEMPPEGTFFYEDPNIDTIRTDERGRIEVFLHKSSEEPPLVLGSRLFSVTKGDSLAWAMGKQSWPIGSAAYIAQEGDYPSGVLVPTDPTPLPALVFDPYPRADPRDELAAGADMLITDDPDVLDYARSTPELQTTALPHDRVYALVSTTRFVEDESVADPPDDAPSLSEAFGGGAVRADIRTPSGPYWWEDPASCALKFPPFPSGVARPSASFYTTGRYRILYDQADPIARDVAERIVAISLDVSSSNTAGQYLGAQIPRFESHTLTSQGLTREELGRRQRTGEDFAYVVSLPIRPDSPCAELRYWTRKFRWLLVDGHAFERALLPLVETRPYLVTRDNHPALYVDWFGNVSFGPPSSERRP